MSVKAMTQACAFSSPETGSLSVIGIFRQSPAEEEIKNPVGLSPAGSDGRNDSALGQATADHAGNAYQTGSEKTQCAGLRNLRRRVTASDSKASTGTAIITHDAEVKSEAADLTNIGIENGEGQGCGKLLTMAQRSFEQVAERKRSYAGIRLQTGAHIADTEIGQRTTG